MTAVDVVFDPAVMVPWCEAVGLDATRVSVLGFSIGHTPDGAHEASYQEATDNATGLEATFVSKTLVVSILPWECPEHPSVPFIARRHG